MKITKYAAFFATALFAVSFVTSHVFAITDGGSGQVGVVSSNSSNTDQDAPAGVNSSSAAHTSQDSNAGVVSNSSTDTAQDAPAGVNSNSSTNTNQDTPAPVIPTTNTGGSTGNGGPTAFGGGSSGGNAVVAVSTSSGTSTISCPLISTFMKQGWNNNASEVSKLQFFLKASEKLNVDINGSFDQKTEDAVKAFQQKYMSDVMGPWGATKTSGVVLITTSKKINELACQQPLVLSASDLAAIQSYRTRTEGQNSTSTDIGSAAGQANLALATTSGNGANLATDNTASVGNASILQRFWNFLTNLF